MERFGPKKKTLLVEKRTKHCYIDDFGYSIFGLGYGWRHVITHVCMRARKQTIVVDFFYIALITSIMFLSLSITISYRITTFHKL